MQIFRIHDYREKHAVRTGATVIDTQDWRYVSIPTMIGCPIRCTFCPSSQPGQPYKGPEASEAMAHMVLQALGQPRENPEQSYRIELSLSGEGEALLNAQAVLHMIDAVLQHAHIDRVRLACSGRGMENLAEFAKVVSKKVPLRLWFSMHFTNDAERMQYIPHTIALEKAHHYLTQAQEYCEEVSINMVYFPDKMYTPQHTEELITWLKGQSWKIQVQPLLTGAQMNEQAQSQWEEHKHTWVQELHKRGLHVVVFQHVSTRMEEYFWDLTYRVIHRTKATNT